jgi:hypothetical protein
MITQIGRDSSNSGTAVRYGKPPVPNWAIGMGTQLPHSSAPTARTQRSGRLGEVSERLAGCLKLKQP